MTEKANPSFDRKIDSFKTAGAIAYGGHGNDGFVIDSANPTEISKQDSGISEGNFNTFNQTSGGASLDVDIDAGEAFVFGSWLAIDTQTTVSLASSTNNQVVYVGWNKDGSDDVIVGLNSAFDNASGNTDMKIPLWEFDTDGTGVTASRDQRVIGQINNSGDGTVSNPSYTFTNDQDTGIFRNASDDMRLVANGSFILGVDTNTTINTTLALNDQSSDPSTNGHMQLNGSDVKVYSGGSVRNISNIGGGGGGSSWTQTTKTSNYTASNDESVWADSSSSAITITLPAPTQDYHVRVVNIDNSNGVTLSENGSEGINDQSGTQSTISMTDGESITVESDGSTWWVV